MSTFALPDLGEGLQEAEIVAWHVSEGDHVVADQPLVSVETAKAVVEIPAPQSGRVTRLHGKPGEMVAVGAPLAEFDGGDAGKSETVVGELPHEQARAPSRKAPAAEPAEGRARAAPAVRKLARDLSVDLETVAASGPGGTVLADDVRRAAEGQGGGEPLRGTRRAMARAMAESGRQIVPATVTDDVDVGAWFGRDDPMVRLVAAVVAACRAEPALNAWYDAGADRVERRDSVDLGIAVDTADGLFVPVLRDAGSLAPAAMRAALDALEAGVRERSMSPRELSGQTMTLSNFGAIAGRHASLVIVPPQVAILGAGRIRDEVVASGGKPAVRPVLPLSLTFDHRVVTGGEAARFLLAVIGSLEKETVEES